jgi:xanthine dehydrogenase accessory factor
MLAPMNELHSHTASPRCALVLGSNDVASAVALSLARKGFVVLLAETPSPVVTRRGQSFADVAFDGVAMLEGISARLIDDPVSWVRCASAETIAFTLHPLDEFATALAPVVWVDARMKKRTVPEDQRGRAALVIGLGPNFVAGVANNCNVDLAVETAYGDILGQVIEAGPTSVFAGEPKPIGGYGRERYVYAPMTGTFRTHLHIGDYVVEGETVAHIDETPVSAPKTGVLRGLVRDGVPIRQGMKAVEVVPAEAKVLGVGERPAAIAAGVIAALRVRGRLPAA